MYPMRKRQDFPGERQQSQNRWDNDFSQRTDRSPREEELISCANFLHHTFRTERSRGKVDTDRVRERNNPSLSVAVVSLVILRWNGGCVSLEDGATSKWITIKVFGANFLQLAVLVYDKENFNLGRV
ncbi:hypothetical protein AVEN_81703-1 [Araneus ventricosus]|uniref:Uncharacterized protein n=1 Tax=Araneus ventricosus TaxID=182803 RepID=A0A4Y2KAB5_ARAVE|nr:hypothetical protein AVEN_229257-1 [Araneus ventricosus]GBM99398.1 hypothetical protein AVEN_81703-1 [Araneus ventricosus]